MPKSELGSAVDTIRNAQKKLVVVGYGYKRNRTEAPWFRRGDLVGALETNPARRLIIPSKAQYSDTLDVFADKGIVDIRPADKGEAPGVPARLAHITELGEEALLEAVVYNVTKRGLTVPEMLHIPEVVEVVLYQSDLRDRVFKAISGQNEG